MIGRRAPDIIATEVPCRQIQNKNLTRVISGLVASRMCTLHELQTVYSYEDALNLWDVVCISSFNEYLLNKHYESLTNV